jgi:2-dehydropantoate 2-reductase
LIVVSVNHHQIASVVELLAPNVGNATVLMFNNLFVDPMQAISPIPPENVVWGFPGGGGGIYGGSTLKGGISKMIFLGKIGSTGSDMRYEHVRMLFKNARFSVLQQSDFHGWLWFKFLLNAGLEAGAAKAGGFVKLYDSAENVKYSLLLAREMLPLLKAKGNNAKLSYRLMLKLPVGIMGFAMCKAMQKGTFARSVMEHAELSGHISKESSSTFYGDVLKEAQELGVTLPMLENLLNS